MPNYHVRILGRDREAMADVVRKHGVHVIRSTARALDDGGYAVTAVADDDQIEALEADGYEVERHEDVDAAKMRDLEEVGQGNRYEEALPDRAAPGGYLSVAEVESALARVTGPPNHGFTQLITLPHPTWEGRRCHAVRIHRGGRPRTGVYLLGGVHAREWGSPDILIHFVETLTDAYRTETGITVGPKLFSAAEVKMIVEDLELIVFPQANPDGRQHSMTVDPMWRKNRRPPSGGHCTPGGGNGPGVDVNRNYDFLWDYPRHFSQQAPVASSIDPCEEVYIGPGPASEPETQNVVWIMDAFPRVRFFMDLHSFGQDVLYTWGDDDDQSTDADMTFCNSAYDGVRGVPDSSSDPIAGKYREYIDACDRTVLVELAESMKSGIQAVHGADYTVKQSVGLYPTSGTSDDYAYGRGFTDGDRGKIFSFTLEWGPDNPEWTIPQRFHPPYASMRLIIEEVTCGLLQFCLAALRQHEAALLEDQVSV